jgi:hypothetical protein
VRRLAHRHKAGGKKALTVARKSAPPPSAASPVAETKPAKADAAKAPASHSGSPVAETAAQKKPSAGIPKETPPN